MSQNSIVLPTTGTVSGLTMTQNTNNALDTLNTLNSGASAPSTIEAGMLWHDTTANALKIRNLANSAWIVLGLISETNGTFTAASSVFVGGATGGSANAQTLSSTTPGGFTLTAGNIVSFNSTYNNTGSTTLNVNSTGAVTVYKNGPTGTGPTALTGGELVYQNAYLAYVLSGTQYLLINPTLTPSNTYQASPSNPTSTTSTTYVMMGLAGSITPKYTGSIYFQISGVISNSGTGGTAAELYIGTGSAPANGAAYTGTQVGRATEISPTTGGGQYPFSIQGIATGLTVGTAYWLDLALAAVSGTASVINLSVTAFEIK